MKYSLRSLMIAVLVLPPLAGWAVYFGGLPATIGVVFAFACLVVAAVGRTLAI